MTDEPKTHGEALRDHFETINGRTYQVLDGKAIARKVAARMAKLWKTWEGTAEEFEAANRRWAAED
jgi:hypothetical protein